MVVKVTSGAYIVQVFDQPRRTSVGCAVTGPSPMKEAHLLIVELRWDCVKEAEQLQGGERERRTQPLRRAHSM